MTEIILHITLFFGLFLSILWFVILLFLKYEPKKKYREFKFEDVSILIPAYNEENSIEKTIKSCLNLVFPKKVLIYIINDGSKDNTKKIVEYYTKKYKNVFLIDKKNSGKSSSLNLALKEKVKTNYFAVVDADSTVDKNSLKFSFREFFLESGNLEKIAAVISKMEIKNKNTFINRFQKFSYYFSGVSRFFYSKIQLLYITPGVLSLYNKKYVEKVGFFDEKNICEDFEIAYNLRSKNYRIIYCENSKVKTNAPETWKIYLKQQIRWARGFIQTNKKHKRYILNCKSGFWGLFMIPISIISPILLIFLFFSLIKKTFQGIYEKILTIIYNPSFFYDFFAFDIKKYILNLDLFIALPVLIGLIYIFFLVIETQKIFGKKLFSKEKLKNISAFLFFVLIYGYLFVYVFLKALIMEIRKEKLSWGTK